MKNSLRPPACRGTESATIQDSSYSICNRFLIHAMMSILNSLSAKTLVIGLLLAAHALPGLVRADTANAAKPGTQASSNAPAVMAPLKANNARVESPAARLPDNPFTRLHKAMPYLEQALIIFTSANGFVIVCGAVLLFLKARMQRQSALSFATAKAPQRTESKTAADFFKPSETHNQ